MLLIPCVGSLHQNLFFLGGHDIIFKYNFSMLVLMFVSTAFHYAKTSRCSVDTENLNHLSAFQSIINIHILAESYGAHLSTQTIRSTYLNANFKYFRVCLRPLTAFSLI